MYHIDIVGMRKRRNLKIVIAIIIISIILALCSIGYIIHNRKVAMLASTNIVVEDTDNINAKEQKNTKENIDTNNKEEEKKKEKVKNNDNSSDKNNKGDDSNKDEQQEGNTDPVVSEEKNKNKEFIDKINNIYNGEEGKRVFLTFDDGPSESVTPKILDILDKYDIKATFFVLGCNAKSHPDIVKRAYDSGHYIANHGYSHKYSKIYKNTSTVLEEYNKTEDAIRVAIGNPEYSSNLFRFPGGAYGGPYEKIKKKARKELNKQGIAYLDWSALTYDAEGADTKEEILCNLKETMNGWNNVVILMHDAPDKEITYKTLEDVIKYLEKNGYDFKNIYDLM